MGGKPRPRGRKFSKRDVVTIGTGPSRELGYVVGHQGRTYRVFTYGRRQKKIDSRRLRHIREQYVLILESNLSSGIDALRSDRQRRQGPFLEEFFRSLEMRPLREKVHTARDLQFFLRSARAPNVPIVHYCGHGEANALALSAERVWLPENEEAALVRRREHLLKNGRSTRGVDRELEQYCLLREIFRPDYLADKLVVLSACDAGRSGGLASYISRISGAEAVIAYSGEVGDDQTNVMEPLLYWRLLTMWSKRRTTATLVSELRELAVPLLGTRVPLTCFVAGERVVPA